MAMTGPRFYQKGDSPMIRSATNHPFDDDGPSRWIVSPEEQRRRDLISDAIDELDRSAEREADGLCAFETGDSFLYDGPACEDVGMFYDRPRHFDPTIGAWLSDEPLAADEAMNLYRYVSNLPADAVDPTQIAPVGE
jgi:RHS repeat-associated protein